MIPRNFLKNLTNYPLGMPRKQITSQLLSTILLQKSSNCGYK
jgi:uncharacterized protein YfaS (alpha-2-macroglobulin family)